MEEKKIDRRDEGAIDISRLLQEFLPVLKKLFWIPLALAAIVGALWFAKGYFSYTPSYVHHSGIRIRQHGAEQRIQLL